MIASPQCPMPLMHEKIEKVLRETPGLKAKDVAKKLPADKKEVNSCLYAHPELFQVDDKFCWTLVQSGIRIEFASDCWVNCRLFETAIAQAGSPLGSNEKNIVFVIPAGCRLLLETIARFMALCNQLIYVGKKVTLDFTSSTSAFTYLDRAGFFDQLHKDVAVLPERPETSAAFIYRGNSDNLVEFGAIDPISPDETLPKHLKESFVTKSDPKYSHAAFTVISELFGNVRDHSESPIQGFVALQFYKGKTPHIQTVISDSGKGIVGTLRPILADKYPEIATEIGKSSFPYEKSLLKKVFTKGRISQSNDEGRGLGLKRSTDEASQFDATILVRQEHCEAKFIYKMGKLADFQFTEGMPQLLGTHICFDFPLDQGIKSSLN
jgi:hypothetical protein